MKFKGKDGRRSQSNNTIKHNLPKFDRHKENEKQQEDETVFKIFFIINKISKNVRGIYVSKLGKNRINKVSYLFRLKK